MNVLSFSVGSRGKKAFKELTRQLRKYKIDHYATDEWKIYRKLDNDKHLISKKHTTNYRKFEC